MTYYRYYTYAERYRISFKDIEDNDWRVSIEQPDWSGGVTELTGADEPVRWCGEGKEDQTEVMRGTTGFIRIVCQDGQESVFTQGNLLPYAINDRRVRVLRYTQVSRTEYIWAEYWQGFIKPNIFSQEWDCTPYEIELPIVSAIAAAEFFTMPMPGEAAYALFGDQTNIAGLLRSIIIATGCNHLNIVTNKPIYIDFNNQTYPIPVPGTEPVEYYDAHWTQGVVSSGYYYDVTDGGVRPKTFKDVLTNILYPYGKICEKHRSIYIMMDTKDDAAAGALLYNLPIWDDVVNHIPSTEVRFRDGNRIPRVGIDDIQVAGTDNRYSRLPSPSSVRFSKSLDTSKDIFELTDKYIKPSLPVGSDLSGKPIEDSGMIESGYRRYVYAINKGYIDLNFASNWYFSNSTDWLADFPFCRVVEVTGETNDANYNLAIPLGFCFNINGESANSKSATTSFTLKNGIRSRNGANLVKLIMKCYTINQKDLYAGAINLSLRVEIHDVTAGKWLGISDGQLVWNDNISGVYLSDFVEESDGFVLLFNEYRASTDNSMHRFEFSLYAYTNTSLPGNTYGRLFTTFKLEYARNKTATVQGIAATFSESIEQNGYLIESGGSGDSLEIAFGTQCGTKNIIINGSVMLPFNSFCNSRSYIDTENREKIEIEAATFERYTSGIYTYDFATEHIAVIDGSKVYIPVSVGMSPRMNTVRLTLVSTNVTSITSS